MLAYSSGRNFYDFQATYPVSVSYSSCWLVKSNLNFFCSGIFDSLSDLLPPNHTWWKILPLLDVEFSPPLEFNLFLLVIYPSYFLDSTLHLLWIHLHLHWIPIFILRLSSILFSISPGVHLRLLLVAPLWCLVLLLTSHSCRCMLVTVPRRMFLPLACQRKRGREWSRCVPVAWGESLVPVACGLWCVQFSFESPDTLLKEGSILHLLRSVFPLQFVSLQKPDGNHDNWSEFLRVMLCDWEGSALNNAQKSTFSFFVRLGCFPLFRAPWSWLFSGNCRIGTGLD